MKADPAEDPQIPQKPNSDSERVASLTQKHAKLEKKVDKLRRTTLNLWALADTYMAQVQYALQEKDAAIDGLRRAKKHGEVVEIRWREKEAKLVEELSRAKERLEQIESTNLAEKLRVAKETEEADQAWKAERAGLQEELRLAEQRIVELETTDMAQQLKEVQENVMIEHRRAMNFWLLLGKERRETEVLREALETGEFPTGIAQGPGFSEELP
ncbi:hypothetical protein EST38_g12673 [Candolleomyces aberdarensis]|uniref:Uncharacterized protein n=1 Tax=Candolleomyces aberdarensis TaxID=2316362 RepID=A0A4Q2D2Z2_9AGAR|nr:hypothetical protein EST38_g12673 [Candolleomyces aberdarensis]